MDTFIKILVVINLWLWTGLFLSSPSLRKAFVDMHRSMASDLYEAMKKQLVKLFKIIADFISRKLRKASHYIEESSYELRVSVARSLVSKELLEELMHKNLVAAISRAQERILLALDRIEDSSPYESVRNEAYRKFIRQ
jgi:hypothetical protein